MTMLDLPLRFVPIWLFCVGAMIPSSRADMALKKTTHTRNYRLLRERPECINTYLKIHVAGTKL